MIREHEFDGARGRFRILDELDAEDRRLVIDRASPASQEPGSLMFEVGDPCSGFGFLLEGCVRVTTPSASGREIVLYRVHPGETCIITAACLLRGAPYPARGTIEESLQAFVLPDSDFKQLMERSRPFRDFVLSIFTQRVLELMELVHEVAFAKLDFRIAARLLELGPVVEMTHQQLADEVGSTREMVSRILESFADRGLLALGRKRIEIQQLERFRSELLGS
jgi:CRP/FNR family transcriptional regulator